MFIFVRATLAVSALALVLCSLSFGAPKPEIFGNTDPYGCNRILLQETLEQSVVGPIVNTHVGPIGNLDKFLLYAGMKPQTVDLVKSAYITIQEKAEQTPAAVELRDTINAARDQSLQDHKLMVCVLGADCFFRGGNGSSVLWDASLYDFRNAPVFSLGEPHEKWDPPVDRPHESVRFPLVIMVHPKAETHMELIEHIMSFYSSLAEFHVHELVADWVKANAQRIKAGKPADALFQKMAAFNGKVYDIDSGFYTLLKEGYSAKVNSQVMPFILRPEKKGPEQDQLIKDFTEDRVNAIFSKGNVKNFAGDVITAYKITPENIFQVTAQWLAEMRATTSTGN